MAILLYGDVLRGVAGVGLGAAVIVYGVDHLRDRNAAGPALRGWWARMTTDRRAQRPVPEPCRPEGAIPDANETAASEMAPVTEPGRRHMVVPPNDPATLGDGK
jgi:hypothetical protein